jgi:hypothetical protein
MEMIAKFNPVMTDPLIKCIILERKIQNEIILAIERKIKERILEMLTF